MLIAADAMLHDRDVATAIDELLHFFISFSMLISIRRYASCHLMLFRRHCRLPFSLFLLSLMPPFRFYSSILLRLFLSAFFSSFAS